MGLRFTLHGCSSPGWSSCGLPPGPTLTVHPGHGPSQHCVLCIHTEMRVSLGCFPHFEIKQMLIFIIFTRLFYLFPVKLLQLIGFTWEGDLTDFVFVKQPQWSLPLAEHQNKGFALELLVTYFPGFCHQLRCGKNSDIL